MILLIPISSTGIMCIKENIGERYSVFRRLPLFIYYTDQSSYFLINFRSYIFENFSEIIFKNSFFSFTIIDHADVEIIIFILQQYSSQSISYI